MSLDVSVYRTRREKVLERMGEGVMVLFSAPVFTRNNDVEHPYRQDSDFYYLTGFDEPDSVLVLSTAHPEHKTVLFVRGRNKEREIWDGPRAGVEGAVSTFGADAAFLVEELPGKLPDYIANVTRLHHRLGVHRPNDERVLRAIDVVRGRGRTGAYAPTEIVDPTAIVHDMRLRKDAHEVALMRRAAEISREGHVRAMQATKPGRFEYEVESELLSSFRRGGAERPAYESIVGSGPNATILHYRKNDRQLGEGELLLIDAGCEYGYYASDVTRTFPVSGRFSEAQRLVYDVVLDAQRVAIEAVRPGVTIDDIHDLTVTKLVEGMCRIGLLEGPPAARIEDGAYKALYMHRTSHWLGMDVHDVGGYFVKGTRRAFEPGFVLTVEPGIYIADDAAVPERFRGIGIRIEDDILVTERGYDNLTAAIPKTADDIERAMAG